MLPRTLTLALDGTQPACLMVHSQTRAQEALKHTSEQALKYTSNCTRWYTPRLLGSTLPSTLSRGKTLPISLDYMLTCTLLHDRSRDLLSCRSQAAGGVSCRRQAPGGVRQVAYGGQRLAGGMWHVVLEMAGGVWWPNHDIGRYHCLNLIFSVATETRSHDASWSWC
jgi:hypothetical protein